jgi:hypothetical protein
VASQPDLGRVEAEPAELLTSYKGYIDKVLLNTIDGWAMDLLAPSRRLKVVAMLNGEVVGEASCDRFRPDLRDNGFGDGYYGFHMVMARAFDRNLPFSVHVETAPSGFELTFPSLAFPVEPLDVAPASSQPEQSAAVEFAVGPGASALEANGDAAIAPSDLHAVVEALRVQVNRLQSTLDVARPGVAARHGEAPVPYRALPPSPATLGWTARGTYYQLLSAVR